MGLAVLLSSTGIKEARDPGSIRVKLSPTGPWAPFQVSVSPLALAVRKGLQLGQQSPALAPSSPKTKCSFLEPREPLTCSRPRE